MSIRLWTLTSKTGLQIPRAIEIFRDMPIFVNISINIKFEREEGEIYEFRCTTFILQLNNLILPV